MKRYLFFIYGATGHLGFLAIFAYLAGFTGNFLVPKSIDSGPVGPLGEALAINLLLIAAFGLQHSIMARPWFKAAWTQLVPAPIERSTYVWISNVLVVLLVWQWRPMDLVIWNVTAPVGRAALIGLFAAGWLLVPLASLMINHFDLFGTRQVWLFLRGQEYRPLAFRTPLLYGWMRHPLYVGWMVAFWATPTMTAGHLLFAGTLTAYILVAMRFEERDLVEFFGDKYSAYRRQVGAFMPRLRRGGEPVAAPAYLGAGKAAAPAAASPVGAARRVA